MMSLIGYLFSVLMVNVLLLSILWMLSGFFFIFHGKLHMEYLNIEFQIRTRHVALIQAILMSALCFLKIQGKKATKTQVVSFIFKNLRYSSYCEFF